MPGKQTVFAVLDSLEARGIATNEALSREMARVRGELAILERIAAVCGIGRMPVKKPRSDADVLRLRAEVYALRRQLKSAVACVQDANETMPPPALPAPPPELPIPEEVLQLDLLPQINGKSIADLMTDRGPNGMDLSRAEQIGRQVIVHLYRGVPDMALDAVRNGWRTHVEDCCDKSGESLRDTSLAEAIKIDVRTLNILEGAGVLTVGHLLAIGDRLLAVQIANLGGVTLAKLKGHQEELAARVGDVPLPPIPDGVKFTKITPQAPRPPKDAEFRVEAGYRFNNHKGTHRCSAEELAAEFNRRYSVGDSVLYWPVLPPDNHPPRPTTLRGGAFVNSGGEALCFVAGVSGAVSIEHVSSRDEEPAPQSGCAPQKKNDVGGAMRLSDSPSIVDSALAEQRVSLLPLIEAKARAWSLKTGVPIEDLVQAAAMQCWRQLPRFDPARGVKLATWLQYRIDGAIKDHLREHGYFLHGGGRTKRTENIATLHGRFPNGRLVIETEDKFAADTAERREALDNFHELLAPLYERERLVMVLRFREGLPMHEIGESIGVSEARISQMISNILARLRPYAARKLGLSASEV